MGLAQSMTSEQKLANINKLHDNIELIMKLISPKTSYQDRKFVGQTYSSLMRCTFFSQVTNARLLDCLHEHINKWTELNDLTINKDKYVTEKYSHMKQFLYTYEYYVMKKYDA